MEAELSIMQSRYDMVMDKYTAAVESIAIMEKNLKTREDTIRNLEIKNKAATAVADKLNSTLVECRSKFENDKANIIREYKGEVKTWKRELGIANKNHIKLQKKFDRLQTQSLNVNFTQDLPFEVTLPTKERQVENALLDSNTYCSICACQIDNYIQEYFYGEMVNPACERCKIEANLFDSDHVKDPFSSFPIDGVPPSLVSHWISPWPATTKSLLDLPSLKAHYVILPNPGSSFISMEEVLQEFKKMMDEQQRELRESCKVT